MKKEINKFVRENIKNLKPYEAARHLINDPAVFLDANENPYETEYNRYPDPWQRQLKEKIASIKNYPAGQIFIGNGSDEAIDLLIRIFCEPGTDNMIITPPTYGMYQVSASINNVETIKVPLENDFSLEPEKILNAANKKTKLLFLCSPNNPTGNILSSETVEKVIKAFDGMVVIDEAYIDFSSTPSWHQRISEFNNLVVLQTLSKAYGMAGLRIGLTFACQEVIDLLNKVKPPYNISIINQKAALNALENELHYKSQLEEIIEERERIADLLDIFSFIKEIYPSEANFILVEVSDANDLFNYLRKDGIIIRNRSNVLQCEGCLRITIGTPEENDLLIKKLKQYEETLVH